MKKTLLALTVLVGLGISGVAFAAPYEWVWNLNDSGGTPYTYPISGSYTPNEDRVLMYDPSDHQPALVPLNGGIHVDGTGHLSLDNVPTSKITGLDTFMSDTAITLSGKADTVHAHLPSDIIGLGGFVDARISSTTQADWNEGSTTIKGFIKNKPSIGKAYEGTTARSGAFPIFASATVASGAATFYLTTDGTSSGTSTCPAGVIQDSVNAFVSDASASYQMAYAFSNSNKTLTITTNKLTTANILTGILGQATGNGSSVKLTVWCY